MKIITNLSPNYSKKSRSLKDIKFIIIHYTGMQSEIESLKRLKNPKYKVSCHYVINRKGKIFQLVREKNAAWHAGKSKWKKFVNLNNVILRRCEIVKMKIIKRYERVIIDRGLSIPAS